jgi:polyisoprenoid-binding protein YceI
MSTPANYVAGTWTIDAVHSTISFSVRHLGVSKAKGTFGHFSGAVVTGENPADSTVEATVSVDSIDTKNADRDAHVKSPDFFDVENFSHAIFASTALKLDGEDVSITGDLTLHGVTKSVELVGELGGILLDNGQGGTVLGLSVKTKIDRTEFGIGTAIPAAVLGKDVTLDFEIEAILNK